MRTLWAGLLIAMTVGGCMVGPDYHPPQVKTPSAWNGVPTGDATTQPAAGPTTRPAQVDTWWNTLDDPILNSLLMRSVESNLDLRVATARVREARAARGVVAADLWPQIGVSGSYRYGGGSLNTGAKQQSESLGSKVKDAAIGAAVGSLTSGQTVTAQDISQKVLNQVGSTVLNDKLAKTEKQSHRGQNLFQAGFDASWELDVFGGTRRAVEAADADVAAVEDNRNDILISVLSEVALNYVQLRGYQRRLAIARENIVAQQATLDLTQKRQKAGLYASMLDVAQAQAQLAGTQSNVPLLITAIKQTIYQISVLLGQSPATLMAELDKDGAIPKVPGEVPVGLPSDLLRRRPDIRAAERDLAAATARIGEATAELFPRFSLTGAFGPQSRNINQILDRNSLSWSIGPGVSWPIFDGWRIRSNIEVQNARQEQSLATYEKTVLTAFQDVENALIAYTSEQIRHEALANAVEASQRAKTLSNELYVHGMGEFLNVLEAQRAIYSSQDALVDCETSVITNLISLYKALGGGWSPSDHPGAAPG